MNAPVSRPKDRRTSVTIPPEEAVALLLLAIEVAAVAVQRRRIALSSRVYRLKRDLEFAVNHDHGLSELARETMRHLRLTPPG
jgi:hypothetical protein